MYILYYTILYYTSLTLYTILYYTSLTLYTILYTILYIINSLYYILYYRRIVQSIEDENNTEEDNSQEPYSSIVSDDTPHMDHMKTTTDDTKVTKGIKQERPQTPVYANQVLENEILSKNSSKAGEVYRRIRSR